MGCDTKTLDALSTCRRIVKGTRLNRLTDFFLGRTDFSLLLFPLLSPFLPTLSLSPLLAFHYTIDILILSSPTPPSSLSPLILLATRAALWDLRIPRTKETVYEAPEQKEGDGDLDKYGIKSIVRGDRKARRRGGGREGKEFELEDFGDDGVELEEEIRMALPVCVDLYLVRKRNWPSMEALAHCVRSSIHSSRIIPISSTLHQRKPPP